MAARRNGSSWRPNCRNGLQGSTFYILDEPTTGLSFDDCSKLMDVLHRLVDAGNTVVLIEHHLDLIKNADWLIDLGPLAGDGGGELVAEGTPEYVASVAESHTGRYLLDVPGIIPDAELPGIGRCWSPYRAAKAPGRRRRRSPPKARLPRREIAQGQNQRPAPPSKTSTRKRLTSPSQVRTPETVSNKVLLAPGAIAGLLTRPRPVWT